MFEVGECIALVKGMVCAEIFEINLFRLIYHIRYISENEATELFITKRASASDPCRSPVKNERIPNGTRRLLDTFDVE